MKQKYQALDEQQGLSNDIEWMVQSGQVSPTLLLEALGKTYYKPLYQLAFSLLEDPTAARTAVHQIFEKSILELHHYRSQIGIDVWLYRIAWKECLRVAREESIWRKLESLLSLRGAFTEANPIPAASETEQTIRDVIEALDQNTQWFFILRYLHGWSEIFISQVTGYEEGTILACIEAGRKELLQRCRGDGLEEDSLDSLVQQTLKVRYQAGAIPDNGPEQMVTRAEGRAKIKHRVRGGLATFNELAVIAIALILVAVLIWGGNQLLLR